jgi:polar amino acid transport system substrate-binding protein
MRVPTPTLSLTRLALTAALFSLLGGGLAFAQQPPSPQAATGYADPEDVPARPPAVDVEPVWARPAIDTVATIRKRGRLRVGVVANEPYVMRNAGGELTGFSIDVGRQLATDLGVDVEFVVTSWTQVIADLVGNHFDVIACGLWITPQRALVVNFSTPVSMGTMSLVASKALAATMKTRQDFDRPDVRIVVYAGSSQEGVAARLFPKATLVKVEGDADPVAPVVEGKAHALLVTTPTPQLVVDHAPDRLFLPLADPLQRTTAALGVRKGDVDFLNFLDSWVAFQREGGWLAERQAYWFRTTEWLKGL